MRVKRREAGYDMKLRGPYDNGDERHKMEERQDGRRGGKPLNKLSGPPRRNQDRAKPENHQVGMGSMRNRVA